MGCGKSTVGQRLAARLGYGFHDVDTMIEEQTGRPITDIFQQEGEAVFRELEYGILSTLCAQSGNVIALGGGALLEDANRRLVEKAGTLLYLRADIATLYERVKHREHRPLLLDDADRVITRDQFAERIAPLMDARQAGYAGADIIIDVDHKEPDAIVDEAVRALH